MGIQSTIAAKGSTLAPSMQRIAAAIRENPSVVLDNTISEIAVLCDTSVASVVRFCRAVGLSGYAQLRMDLATELGRESAQYGDAMVMGADIARSDTLKQIAGKIASLEMLAIEETLSAIDFDILAKVIAELDKAKRILLFGVGASRFVAHDLQQKLFRIGHNAFMPDDNHEAFAAAALSVPKTVAIGFSHSGMTRETVRFIKLASENGALTVALTSADESPLALAADLLLRTHARESSLRAGAMVSRIAQLALIDCLFLGLARLSYDETIVALERTRSVTHP
jgi:DNA-binding MurR/RpiR family transcriptional regulator